MPRWNPSQTSFAAGEITARAISRVDSDVYQQAVLRMRNMMPRSQGPAVRMPGTTFVSEIPDTTTGRVIPFLSQDDRRSLLILGDRSAQIITEVAKIEVLSVQNVNSTLLQRQLIRNPEFSTAGGLIRNSWSFNPRRYNSRNGDVLGCQYQNRDFDNVLFCACRNWKYPEDNTSWRVSQTFEVPEARSNMTLDYRFIYEANPGIDGENYTLTVTVSAGDVEVYSADHSNLQIGSVVEVVKTVALPMGYVGDVEVVIRCSATEFASTPLWLLDRFQVFVAGEPLTENPPIDVVPGANLYALEDLQDVQYVQSPYARKELVLTHPLYGPQWLYINTNSNSYVLEPIPFIDTPDTWQPGNYPAACTAYQGRLMLGGTPRQSETVWGSRPGLWNDFRISPDPTDPNLVLPDSAIEFTTIYRSPIRWMYGHKDLLVGTREYEYVVSADSGLLQPGDIDVRQHSAHGSKAVQPVGFNRYVVFPAGQGDRIRGLERTDNDTGWVAPDLSDQAEHLVTQGVIRMCRMRNPHPMLACLTVKGDIALLHYDEVPGGAVLFGWSTLDAPGDVVDLCTLPLPDGTDALMVLVRYVIAGEEKLYLEGVFDWTYNRIWRYVSSSIGIRLGQPGNVLTGLDHLEGERVQVVNDRDYLGTFLVSNGTVTLLDEAGLPINVSTAVVGLTHDCLLRLLPPATDASTGGISSYKRYSDIIVRTLGSTRPIINGVRPYERRPADVLNKSPYLDILFDNKIANLGTDQLQSVTIQETAPFKLEVLSVSGTLSSEKI